MDIVRRKSILVNGVNFANYASLCAIELKVSEKITYKLPY